MNNENKRHVQVPNNMNSLNNIDYAVYAAIKSYKIGDNPCFPSQETIANKLDLTIPTIRKSIRKLEELNYLIITKKGKMMYYDFPKHNQFEVFSKEFIDCKSISSKAKGYLIGSQQIMFKDIKGFGKTTLSTKELANKINVTEKTVRKLDKELIDKGFLTIVTTSNKDPLTGLKQQERLFNLEKLGQAIIWKLKEHDERITDNEKEIEQIKENNKFLRKQMEILINYINENKKPEERLQL